MAKIDWIPVNDKMPCPICFKKDWCLLHIEGKKVICPRTKSTTYIKDTGFVHNVENNGLVVKEINRSANKKKAPINWKGLQIKYVKKFKKESANLCAGGPDVQLGVGWDGEALTYPLYDGTSTIIGIQRRFPDGGKRFVSRSQNGIFIPKVNHWVNNIFICEGVSDTATILDLGLRAIGRANCQTGTECIKTFLLKHPAVLQAVIVADNDKPGQRGAVRLAASLKELVEAFVISPPEKYKDVREWNPTVKQLLKRCEK